MLDYFLSDPEGYQEGDCIIVTIANESFPAVIYTVRGDSRYTIQYISSLGVIQTSTVKSFQFTRCEEFNGPEEHETIQEIHEQQQRR